MLLDMHRRKVPFFRWLLGPSFTIKIQIETKKVFFTFYEPFLIGLHRISAVFKNGEKICDRTIDYWRSMSVPTTPERPTRYFLKFNSEDLRFCADWCQTKDGYSSYLLSHFSNAFTYHFRCVQLNLSYNLNEYTHLGT